MSRYAWRNGHLCVVDDDPDTETLIRLVADPLGYDVTTARSLPSLARQTETLAPGAVVLAVDAPGVDLLEVLRYLAELPSSPKLILTGNERAAALRVASAIAARLGLRTFGSMTKPVNIDELKQAILRTLTLGS